MWRHVLRLLFFQAATAVVQDAALREQEVLALFDPASAKAMSKLAGLAYCGAYLEVGAVERCSECEAAGFKVVPGSVALHQLPMTYGGKTTEDVNFFILGEIEMESEATKGCFVAVRGSINDMNWVQNSMSDLVKANFTKCPSCGVKEGYFDIVKRFNSSMREYMDSHGCGKGENPIWITGHSLGGGVATLLIASLADMGYNVALSYILEPAMAADGKLRQFFLDVVAEKHPPVPLFSLSNGWDFVPRGVDLILQLGYAPIPYDIHSDPWTGQMLVCFDDENYLDPPNCPRINRDSWWFRKSLFLDHITFWAAPGRFEVLGAIPEECKANPNQLKLKLEWIGVEAYTSLVTAGLSGFVLRLNLLILLCTCLMCCCCYWCCCQDRGAVHPYEKVESRMSHP